MGGRYETCKTRLLAIERMFLCGKPLTTAAILRKLELEYDIYAERKTVYSDIVALSRFMNIVSVGRGRSSCWQYIGMEEILRDE